MVGMMVLVDPILRSRLYVKVIGQSSMSQEETTAHSERMHCWRPLVNEIKLRGYY